MHNFVMELQKHPFCSLEIPNPLCAIDSSRRKVVKAKCTLIIIYYPPPRLYCATALQLKMCAKCTFSQSIQKRMVGECYTK